MHKQRRHIPSLDDELKDMVDRQVTLGIEAIFSAIYAGPSEETISFYHLINRIMMVLQVPMTFVVIKFINDIPGEHYKTNHYSKHKLEIEESMSRVLKGQDSHRYLFKAWHANLDGRDNVYYLLALKADSSYTFKPIEIVRSIGRNSDVWEIASYKLLNLLDGDRYIKYGNAFLAKLPGAMDRLEKNERSRSNYRYTGRAYPSVLKHFEDALLRNSSRYNLDEYGVFDKVFSKIEKNIAKVGSRNDMENDWKGNPPPSLTNFLFFCRDYCFDGSSKSRYDGEYDYNVRVLICSKQEVEIKKYFAWMRNNEKYCRSQFSTERNQASEKIGEQSIADDVNEIFWKNISSESYEVLLKTLTSNFSHYSRSMADNVFDGASFYSAPFSNDLGLGRIFHDKIYPTSIDHLASDDPRINDLLRVVICLYLMQGFVIGHDDSQSRIQVMLNPIEVGGKVWGVAAFVTKNRKFETKLSSQNILKNYDAVWSKNYHIYRDINERFKKNLRTYMNRFYENIIAHVYEVWKIGIEKRKKSNKGISRDVAEAALNESLQFLSCIFPYNVVQGRVRYVPHVDFPWPSSSVNHVVEDEASHSARALLGEHLAVYVVVTEDSCFPSAPGVSLAATAQFVDAVDVAVVMTDSTIRWAVPRSGAKR